MTYNGIPANGATVYVDQKNLLGISRSLAKFNCDNRGCFYVKAKGYIFSRYDLLIRIRYSYLDRWWLCQIRASLIFPIKNAKKCTNKDKTADLGNLDLITVPGIEKTCQLKHCSKNKPCRIKTK
uniref:Uncharacterized protein n=1 Tax=Strongyloides papillosus TaxID=174720 RepID=A0A0N5CIM7_STREA